MGVMYGKVRDGTFWIMDAAALPVEGTETRVNAGDQVCSLLVTHDVYYSMMGHGSRM